MLSAFHTVEPLDWRVFVEQPRSEAFAPLTSAIWRTALLLVAFLFLAVVTGMLLARRLVRPIESIQAAAAKIGSARSTSIKKAGDRTRGAGREEPPAGGGEPAAGFDDYLSKPVDVVEFLDTVRRHCEGADR